MSLRLYAHQVSFVTPLQVLLDADLEMSVVVLVVLISGYRAHVRDRSHPQSTSYSGLGACPSLHHAADNKVTYILIGYSPYRPHRYVNWDISGGLSH